MTNKFFNFIIKLYKSSFFGLIILNYLIWRSNISLSVKYDIII